MIYEVKKDDKVFEIEDNIFFEDQLQEFKDLYLSICVRMTEESYAEFDNCYVYVYNNGRVIITLKQSEDGAV